MTKSSLFILGIFCLSILGNLVLAIISLCQARRLQRLAKYEKTLVEVRRYTDSL